MLPGLPVLAEGTCLDLEAPRSAVLMRKEPGRLRHPCGIHEEVVHGPEVDREEKAHRQVVRPEDPRPPRRPAGQRGQRAGRARH